MTANSPRPRTGARSTQALLGIAAVIAYAAALVAIGVLVCALAGSVR